MLFIKQALALLTVFAFFHPTLSLSQQTVRVDVNISSGECHSITQAGMQKREDMIIIIMYGL